MVVVRIEENRGVSVELPYESERQFRHLYVDREGCPRILGKLPWGTIKKPFREWLRDWAAEQDVPAFEATIQELLPGMNTEAVLALFEQSSGEAKAYFQDKCGKRDGGVVFDIVIEMLRAVVRQLRKRRTEPNLHWEVESLPNNGGIYGILLKGGQNDKGVHHNKG